MHISKIAGLLGAALGVAAIVVGTAYPSRVAEVALLAASGAGFLVWYFVSEFEFFRAFSRKRSTHLKLNNALMVALFVFIVVLLNLIVRQYYFRYDLSSSKKYSLAPQSRAVTELVDGEVTIVFFGVEGSKEFGRARDLLEAYRYLNKNIVYEMHDLDRAPLLAKKFGVTEYNTVAVETEKWSVTGVGADEETVTNLLIKGLRSRVIKVYILQGHNERDMKGEGRSGFSRMVGKLESFGYRVEALHLLDSGGVPPDADLLVIAAPRSELSEEEYDMLESYRAGGGKFLVLVDSPEELRPLLESFDLKLSDYPIYDRKNVAGTDPSTPLVDRYYGDSPITREFGLSTVYPGVHEVTDIGGGEGYRYGYEYTDLVRASRDSWYEMNGDGIMQKEEEGGHLTIAVIVSHSGGLMKAVVFGDSDFASNAYASVEGNVNLFLNTVNWLVGEGALTKVAPGKREFVPMFVTDSQAKLIRLLVPVGIPLLILVAGTAVWYRRHGL